jgi:hypothetical protein
MHVVYLYDARGERVRSDAITTIDRTGVRTEVTLQQDQSAVVAQLPMTLEAPDPVNARVSRYDDDCLRVSLNGIGSADMRLAKGPFPIAPGATYQVTVGKGSRTVKATEQGLSFSVRLTGVTDVAIRRADAQ